MHADELQKDWQCLLDTETVCRKGRLPKAQSPLEAVFWASQPLCRLLFMILERNGWRAAAEEVQVMCKAVFKTTGDSKCIEDTHQHLRDLTRDNKNAVVARNARQNACITAGVIEGRGMRTVTVTSDDIVQKRAASRKHESTRPWYEMKAHSISEGWQDILAPRTWQSPSPESGFYSVHAWQWIRQFWRCTSAASADDAADAAVEADAPAADHAPRSLADGWVSSTLVFNTIIKKVDTGAFYLVLVPGKWASLCAKLECIGDGAVVHLSTSSLHLQWICIHVQSIAQFLYYDHIVCSPAYMHQVLPSCSASQLPAPPAFPLQLIGTGLPVFSGALLWGAQYELRIAQVKALIESIGGHCPKAATKVASGWGLGGARETHMVM